MRKITTNPFVVGKVVTGDAFANRQSMLAELLLDVSSGQNIILFGPRRIGKTSLVRELLREARKQHDMSVIYIDLLRFDTVEQIAGQVFHQLAGAIDKAIELARSVIKGASIRFDDSSLELSLSPNQDILLKVFDFLDSKSTDQKRIVVVFDEFQELEVIAPDKIKTLRSVIQHHDNVSYVFTGSKQRLKELFTSNRNPFYKFGKILLVGKPNRDEVITFVQEKFLATGFNIPTEAAAAIIDATSNFPYFTQMLAHECWNYAFLNNIKIITSAVVAQSFKTVKNRLRVEHEGTWASLTRNQRIACKILAYHEAPYQKEILRKYNVSQSSLQQAIASLREKQIIWKNDGNYEFLDPFFKHWIRDQHHI